MACIPDQHIIITVKNDFIYYALTKLKPTVQESYPIVLFVQEPNII